MGLFDMFTKEGKFKRHVRRMSDLDSQPEDREASAHFLADEGSGKALMGLLSRFDVSMTQQLKDKGEKDIVYSLLLRQGEALERPLRVFVKRCKTYAWPLRLMLETLGEAATVEAVLDLLDGPVGADSFEPGKRKELLVWLAEHPHPEAIPRVSRFLKDFDEEVRYATAEVVIAQEDAAGREPLLEVLADADEESLRVKHRIAGVFRDRAWSVGEAIAPGPLFGSFSVHDGRVVGG